MVLAIDWDIDHKIPTIGHNVMAKKPRAGRNLGTCHIFGHNFVASYRIAVIFSSIDS